MDKAGCPGGEKLFFVTEAPAYRDAGHAGAAGSLNIYFRVADIDAVTDGKTHACGGLEDGVGTGLSPDAGTFADNNIQHAREESSGELLHRRIGFV
jgi:hypothetical protein